MIGIANTKRDTVMGELALRARARLWRIGLTERNLLGD